LVLLREFKNAVFKAEAQASEALSALADA